MNQKNTQQLILKKTFADNAKSCEMPMYKSYDLFDTNPREYVYFQEFLESNLTRNFVLDDIVKVNVSFKSSDFNDNRATIYKAYQIMLEVVDEIKCRVLHSIKAGLSLLDYNIEILSESLYNSKIERSTSVGCFSRQARTIFIKVLPSNHHHIGTLHHEIGHFIDFVNSLDRDELRISGFGTRNRTILHQAFKAEVGYLASYAKTSIQEFFAVAYEHKMTGGDMKNLNIINSFIKDYLGEFKSNINFIRHLVQP